MLRRFRRYLGQQRLIPWIGEFKETLAQAAFWFTIVNFIMIGGTFYFTTLRHILPWFRLPIFIAFAIAGIVVILIVEFKFITPSIWAFRGRQMDLRHGATIPRRRRYERRDSPFTDLSRRRSDRRRYR